MAYKKLSFDSYNEEALRIERLKRFGNPFQYANGINLAALQAANEEVNKAIKAKNAQLDIIDPLTEAYNIALDKRDKLLINFRGCIGSTIGKDSDEYVTAGGVRQSEVTEKQQQTREANKKAADEKDKLAS